VRKFASPEPEGTAVGGTAEFGISGSLINVLEVVRLRRRIISARATRFNEPKGVCGNPNKLTIFTLWGTWSPREPPPNDSAAQPRRVRGRTPASKILQRIFDLRTKFGRVRLSPDVQIV